MLLWLRVLIEGEYLEALRFALPVIGITAVCCWAATRWAVRQFENESVLFRESERFGLGIWLRHLVRDSGATPSAAQAFFCGVLLLLVTFFGSLRAAVPTSWIGFVNIVLVTQIGLIATPALLMTLVLTRSPRRTLLLVAPRWSTVPAAFLLALAVNPLAAKLAEFISATYPLSEEARRSLEPMVALLGEMPLIAVVLVIGLAPAICEELAFRGFILSGLRRMGSKWTAIVISSLFFGLTHGLLQQSLAATAVGIAIGYIAVQSGSLVPGMVFHCTHNSLSLLAARVTPTVLADHPWLNWLFRPVEPEAVVYAYHWPWLALGAAVGTGILLWFRQLTPQRPRGRPTPIIDGRQANPRHGRVGGIDAVGSPVNRHGLYVPRLFPMSRSQVRQKTSTQIAYFLDGRRDGRCRAGGTKPVRHASMWNQTGFLCGMSTRSNRLRCR